MKETDIDIKQIPTTRERILTLLASRPHTIDELAKKTFISKNAVRAQIATLGREGIVELQGVYKGVRRPAALYGLSPGSDLYFSKAYPTVLSHLMLALAGKLTHDDFIAVMEELGRRLADSAVRPSGNPQERIQAALKVLRALGSLGQVSEENGDVVITGLVCPISRAVAADARACKAMETLLHELTGLPVKEGCMHGKQHSCRFVIGAPGKEEKVS